MSEITDLRSREAELSAAIRQGKNGRSKNVMGFTRQQYEKAASQFLEQNPKLALKYFHPQLLATIVEWMRESLPSVTAARIAFDRLVAEGVLERTDGGNEDTDRAAAVDQARATLREIEEKVGNQPLDRATYEYFASLSARELSRLYFGEDGSAVNEFAATYRAAMRQWGFREPVRFDDTPAAPEWVKGL